MDFLSDIEAFAASAILEGEISSLCCTYICLFTDVIHKGFK